MKRLLTAGVLIGAMTCAHAGDFTSQDLTKLVATVGIYDLNCEPVVATINNNIRLIFEAGKTIPHNELLVAAANAQAQMERVGHDKWCATFRPLINNEHGGPQ